MAGLVFVLAILAFMLDVWGVIRLLESTASNGVKFAWVVGMLLFPIVGFVAWFIAGPKGRAVFI